MPHLRIKSSVRNTFRRCGRNRIRKRCIVLFDLHQDSVGSDGLSRTNQYLFYRTGKIGRNGILHLHRFEDGNFIAGLDRIVAEVLFERTRVVTGENLLLTGEKATGKNVLAETLAYVFGRPTYNVSFHVNTGSAELIGTDTFQNQEVTLRKGSIYRCAEEGGFGILDEINMAKNDAVSVLHAALDYRRIIDVPGYDKIPLHPAARMIGTMNYGYAGTRELNEALVSRFLVIDMPPLTEETLFYLMQSKFPDLKPAAREALAGLYLDLQKKAKQAEITTRALDLRGLFGAIGTMRQGLSPYLAVQIGIVNKCFDLFEKEIVRDVVRTRIPEEWTPQDIF